MSRRENRTGELVVVLLSLALGACVEDGPQPDPTAASPDPLGAASAEEGCDRCPRGVPKPEPGRVVDVPIGDSPVRGADAAKVTIVEACDFECRYCRQVQPALEQLRETYGNSVRLVFKHNPMPFHEHAMGAALAAEAAREQGKFWPMHDRLLASQGELSEASYLAWADELGLDLERFKADLAADALRARIEADQQLVQSLGGRGTPSFWFNGHFVNGAQPFSRLSEVVFDLLADRTPSAASIGSQEDCGCAKTP